MSFSLERTNNKVKADIGRLRQILDDMPMTANSRYALAEIVLIRASAVFEDALAEIAYKLACGAEFRNGRSENLSAVHRSRISARIAMLCDGGAKATPANYLKWTKAKYIGQSVKGVLDPNGPYITITRRFGQEIAEIFAVRNHAAHRNSSSRTGYMLWVKQQYGQERRLRLGYFLLTTNLRPTSNIQRYLTQILVITDDLVAGD